MAQHRSRVRKTLNISVESRLAVLWFVRPALLAFPAHAIFGVFEHNTACGQLVTNLIAASKIAAATSLLTFVDQCLYFRINYPRFVITENVQHGIKPFDDIEQLSLIVSA